MVTLLKLHSREVQGKETVTHWIENIITDVNRNLPQNLRAALWIWWRHHYWSIQA